MTFSSAASGEAADQPRSALGVVRCGPAALVALGAAVATAHGLYEVAVASKVPGPIAWLYPLVTDGLALVAYTATRRLSGKAAGYSWACVVLAAGLSGLAQAAYLAADTVAADPALRFGVGAWPAVAAGLAAHLLHLLVTAEKADGEKGVHSADTPDAAVAPAREVVSTETGPETRAVVEPDPVPGSEELPSVAPRPAPAVGTADTGDVDPRVAAIARRLAAGEELTGPAIAAEHDVSPRTGRRLLGDARAHHDQHAPLHLVTRKDTTA